MLTEVLINETLKFKGGDINEWKNEGVLYTSCDDAQFIWCWFGNIDCSPYSIP